MFHYQKGIHPHVQCVVRACGTFLSCSVVAKVRILSCSVCFFFVFFSSSRMQDHGVSEKQKKERPNDPIVSQSVWRLFNFHILFRGFLWNCVPKTQTFSLLARYLYLFSEITPNMTFSWASAFASISIFTFFKDIALSRMVNKSVILHIFIPTIPKTFVARAFGVRERLFPPFMYVKVKLLYSPPLCRIFAQVEP